MTHQYNTRTNKGDFQDALASIEQNITNSINSIKTDINSIKSDISSVKTDLKDEINNLKDVIIKRLQDENATLREWCSKLEQRLVVFEPLPIILNIIVEETILLSVVFQIVLI